jgi:hypothetical protein
VSSVTPVTRQAEHLLRAPGLFNWSTVTVLDLVAGLAFGPILGWI